MRTVLLLLLSGCITAWSCRPASADAHAAAAMAGITGPELMEHVGVLAADSFEGREAGTRGGRAAAVYLMKELQTLGLRGAGERGGCFQSFGRGYRNVMAMLEGSDPELKHEIVMIGAHYDHVGYGSRKSSRGPTGQIHNGADDNASGASSLLETAQALLQLPRPPARSVVFAFWDGEEKGLLGSKHWVQQPTVPLEQIRAYVNVDMVGRLRDEKLLVYGSRSAAGLRRLVSLANEPTGLRLSFVWWINPRSDHYTFFERKIPVLMLHTDLHEDYHRPSDDAHKLSAEGMQSVSRLLFNLTLEMASAETLPEFRRAATAESTAARRAYEKPPGPAPPRLGVSWDADDQEHPGVRLVRVAPGYPAEQAGLKFGDRIVRFDGREIREGRQLAAAVAAAPSKVQVVVHRDTVAQPLTLPLTLDGRPQRLGIAWRANDAEPDAVTIVQVASDSAAAAAGLKRLDRVYQINGRTFSSTEEFEALVTAPAGPVELVVERDGRILTVRIARPALDRAELLTGAAADESPLKQDDGANASE